MIYARLVAVHLLMYMLDMVALPKVLPSGPLQSLLCTNASGALLIRLLL